MYVYKKETICEPYVRAFALHPSNNNRNDSDVGARNCDAMQMNILPCLLLAESKIEAFVRLRLF